MKEIVELTPEDIAKRFNSITGVDFFAGQLQRKGAQTKQGPTIFRGTWRCGRPRTRQLKHFNDQFQTVRVQYGRMKFDTHFETKRGRVTERGFVGVTDHPCSQPWLISSRIGSIAGLPAESRRFEYLAVSNPDYPPVCSTCIDSAQRALARMLAPLGRRKRCQGFKSSRYGNGHREFLECCLYPRQKLRTERLMPGRE